MALASQYSEVYLAGDGVTTTFAFNFEAISANYVKCIVYFENGVGVVPTYSVAPALNSITIVSLTTPEGEVLQVPPVGSQVRIFRNVPEEQNVTEQALKVGTAKQLEKALDNVVGMIQENKYDLDHKTIRTTETMRDVSLDNLEDATDGAMLYWQEDGHKIKATDYSQDKPVLSDTIKGLEYDEIADKIEFTLKDGGDPKPVGEGIIHNDLKGRNANDCHPKSAITGLVQDLQDLADADTRIEAKADEALETANSADAKADQAIETADTAIATAREADNRSQQALTNSQQAIVTSEDAKQKAIYAVDTAEEAESTANTALTTAQSADTKADTAVATSERAEDKADSAVETADDADEKADNAVQTADEAKTIAEGIEAKADQAIETANTASTTATNAYNKAEQAEQAVASKSTVSVSATGTSTSEVQYITIDGVEKKLAGGSGGGNVDDVKVNGTSVVTNKVANIDLTGKEDVSNKTTTITSSSTDTQYPTAKATFEMGQDIREVAEGKTKSFVVSYEDNPIFNSQEAEIFSNQPIIDINGVTHSISEIKLGDNLYIKETDVPDRWCARVSQTIVVPEGYTQLEYIESTGTQWFDTGYTFGQINDIKIKTRVIGAGTGYYWSAIGANASSGEVLLWVRGGETYLNGVSVPTSLIYNKDYDIDFNITDGNASLTVDGVLLGTSTGTSNNKKMYLFGSIAVSGNTTIDSYNKMRIYSCQIINTTDTLVRNFVPAKRNSDDVVGMWDTVSETFFENAGTGEFVAGGQLQEGITYYKLETAKVPVTDVQINGTTIVNNTVANIPLATVATTGSYNDLSNKPTIPTVPTNVSAFTNDAGYQTSTQVSSAISTHNSSSSAHNDIRTAVASKSTVSVSATGTATDEVQYITIDGVEKKLAGGGSGGSGAGRNIGDIFMTKRTDTALAGAVECDGATYNTEDYEGDGSIGELLEAGKLDYISLTAYATAISTKGWCDKIGWNGTGTTTFRVPTLTPHIVQKNNIPVVGNGMTMGMTNGTNNYGLQVGNQTSGTWHQNQMTVATSRCGSTAGTDFDSVAAGLNQTIGLTTDGTKSGIIADTSDTAQLRVMFQLFNATTDEAVATVGTVVADVAGLKDMSNVTEAGKETAIGWNIPDYTAGVALSGWTTSNTNFTIAKDGVVYVKLGHTHNGSEIFYIDDMVVCCSVTTSSYIVSFPNWITLKKGTHTFRCAGSASRVQSVIFYPFQGE